MTWQILKLYDKRRKIVGLSIAVDKNGRVRWTDEAQRLLNAERVTLAWNEGTRQLALERAEPGDEDAFIVKHNKTFANFISARGALNLIDIVPSKIHRATGQQEGKRIVFDAPPSTIQEQWP